MIDYAASKPTRSRRTLLLVASVLAFAFSFSVTAEEYYDYMNSARIGFAPLREVVQLDESNDWEHEFVIDRPDDIYSVFLFRGTGVADVRKWLAESEATLKVVARQVDRAEPFLAFTEDRNRQKRGLAYQFCDIRPYAFDSPLTIRVTAQPQSAPTEVAVSRGSIRDVDWFIGMKAGEELRPVFLTLAGLAFLVGLTFLYLSLRRAS